MRQKLKKIGIYSVLIIILPCIFIVSIIVYRTFYLRTLIIISKKAPLNGLTQLNNSNLLHLDIKKMSLILQKLNPSFLTINILKKHPNTLILQTFNRVPVAKVQVGNIHKFVDQSGFIFTDEDNSVNLPLIVIPEITIYSDQKTDWRVLKAISFIVDTVDQGIDIEQISGNDSDNSFKIKTSRGPEIMLPYSAEMRSKASSLQVIILRFRIEGKNITKVDFRYEKPLVSLSNGEKMSSSF